MQYACQLRPRSGSGPPGPAARPQHRPSPGLGRPSRAPRFRRRANLLGCLLRANSGARGSAAGSAPGDGTRSRDRVSGSRDPAPEPRSVLAAPTASELNSAQPPASTSMGRQSSPLSHLVENMRMRALEGPGQLPAVVASRARYGHGSLAAHFRRAGVSLQAVLYVWYHTKRSGHT